MADKMNFLLLGKTGQGKSATGNMLLNRRTFKTSPNSTSETREVSFSFNHFDQYTMLVVDGPGLEDTDKKSPEEKQSAATNMSKALAMCYGGIDAFLCVLKFGNRFTAEDKATLEVLKRIFGPQYLDHVIVVMTGGDLFQASKEEEELDITFDEWCKKQTGEFRQLYKDCQGRFVLFNNREKDEQKKRAQIHELINTALEIRRKRDRYTNECFDKAEKEREKMIVEAYAPELKRDFQEKVSLLSADLERLMKQPSASEQDRIKAVIQDLKSIIEREDRGHGVLKELRKLVESVEENLNDVNKLHSLAKDLEETRKSKKSWTWLGAVCTVTGGIVCLAAAPVAAAAAVGGAVVAGASGTVIVVKRCILGSKEEQIEKEKNAIEDKLKKLNT